MENPDQSQNPSSPYYLHPGENPGMVLFSPPMNGGNYHSEQSHETGSVIKEQVKFVNGVILVPSPDDPVYDAWERCNTMVISWITRTLVPQIAQSTSC